jgi:hypothetical protein
VRAAESTGGCWGTLADISLGGCYVYTFSPLVKGSALSVAMKTGETELIFTGMVVTYHPGVGMGIEFSGFFDGDGESRLKAFIATLESQARK